MTNQSHVTSVQLGGSGCTVVCSKPC